MSALPAFPGAALHRLATPDEGIALWWCETVADDVGYVELQSWLSPAEQMRAARFAAPALARRYTVGRAALRHVLGSVVGRPPADVPIERGSRGRPRLAPNDGVDFNVSNTRQVALIGVCRRPGTRIGVDVEHRDREVRHEGLARKFCTSHEQASIAALPPEGRRLRFLQLWTCKEAMSKATGDALSAPLRRLDVAVDPHPRLVAGPAPYVPEDWRLLAAAVPADYVATVALWRVPAEAADRRTR